MQYAGISRRFVAVVIDTIFFLVAGLVLALVFGGAYARAEGGQAAAGYELSGGLGWLALGLAFAYYVGCEAAFGATIGKGIVGIRVVRADGSGLSWRRSVVRNVLRIVDGIFVFYVVGGLFALFSTKNQRIGDRAADTLVVDR
jgi:uncharacterized RDD family membrane protein YckC